MRNEDMEIIAVVGGMGPLASSEFVKTIYEDNVGEPEQDAPVVILYSDPTFPDRTDSFLRGDEAVLLEKLVAVLERLCWLGASKIVICCVTIHALLPRIPQRVRDRVISLLDVIFDNLGDQRHLVICSSGTRRSELFESHVKWRTGKDRLIFPDEEDQERIHQMIYKIKSNHSLDEAFSVLRLLLAKHDVRSFIAACTEMHLIARRLSEQSWQKEGYSCLDPLTVLARNLRQGKVGGDMCPFARDGSSHEDTLRLQSSRRLGLESAGPWRKA